MDPFLTLIIPTRDRVDVLESALRSVANASISGSIQLIVADSSGGESARKLTDKFRFAEYLGGNERLSMSDNWNRSLSFARGRFLSIIGDDDAIMPDIVPELRKLASANPEAECIVWDDAVYDWPDEVTPALLTGSLRRGSHLIDGKSLVSAYIEHPTYASTRKLPALYHGAVTRDLLSRLSGDRRFFNSVTPDVYSSFVLALGSNRIIRTHCPLSLRGSSKHSTGKAQSFGGEAGDLFLRENKISAVRFRSDLPFSPTIEWHCVEAYLQATDFLDQPSQINWANVLRELLQVMAGQHGLTQANLDVLSFLAAKCGDATRVQTVGSGLRGYWIAPMRTFALGGSGCPTDANQAAEHLASLRSSLFAQVRIALQLRSLCNLVSKLREELRRRFKR